MKNFHVSACAELLINYIKTIFFFLMDDFFLKNFTLPTSASKERKDKFNYSLQVI